MSLKKLVALALTVLVTGSEVFAGSVTGAPSQVAPNTVWMYSTFGAGDVVFRQTTAGISQCFGFWLRPTDPGFKVNVAALLMAIQTQSSIAVVVDDSQLWTGSGSPYCLVITLGF
jgi:hypothetical protein